MYSVFVDDGGHKRGQTSRPIVGAEIQTNRIFEAHVCLGSYLLGAIQSRRVVLHARSPHNHLVWPDN